VFRIGREEVTVFGTRKAAINHFELLCQRVNEHNETQQKVANNLKKMLREIDTRKVDSRYILGEIS
jgi:hypothetical protein